MRKEKGGKRGKLEKRQEERETEGGDLEERTEEGGRGNRREDRGYTGRIY